MTRCVRPTGGGGGGGGGGSAELGGRHMAAAGRQRTPDCNIHTGGGGQRGARDGSGGGGGDALDRRIRQTRKTRGPVQTREDWCERYHFVKIRAFFYTLVNNSFSDLKDTFSLVKDIIETSAHSWLPDSESVSRYRALPRLRLQRTLTDSYLSVFNPLWTGGT